MLLLGGALLAPSAALAEYKENYVGDMKDYRADYEDTFVFLARDYNLGFVELRAANPTVDPWLPGAGTRLTLPTRHLLPDAPRSGIVKLIHVKTLGGVVKAGQDLIELVPVEDTLLVEVKIRPADIGFVHAGQKASVKITAYDYAIYGQLEAKVENISADTIVDERDRTAEPFFRVRLRTTKATLGTPERPLPIQPGMGASADIQTGQRSLLTYLTKPIFKTFTGALGER